MSKIMMTKEYKDWLKELKQKFTQAQIKAAVKVNSTLLEFYWQLGADIVEKQKTSKWGTGFLQQLSTDLMYEFPDIKGFSYRNLRAIKQWYVFYTPTNHKLATSCSQITKQLVSQLMQIPWGHNLKIISKCQTIQEAIYYVTNTQQNGWSRSVLTHQIENGLWQREGKTIDNFKHTLPKVQSDLAKQTLNNIAIQETLKFIKCILFLNRSNSTSLDDNSNYGEFATIKSQSGLNSYKISVKHWLEKTKAIINYKIHTDAIKQNLIPKHLTKKFRLQLNQQETGKLVANCDQLKSLKHSTSLPHVFTEQIIFMLSAVKLKT